MIDPVCLIRTLWRTGWRRPVVSGHDFREVETHRGCYVSVMRCRWCGHQSVSWGHGEPPDHLVEPDRCCRQAAVADR